MIYLPQLRAHQGKLAKSESDSGKLPPQTQHCSQIQASLNNMSQAQPWLIHCLQQLVRRQDKWTTLQSTCILAAQAQMCLQLC